MADKPFFSLIFVNFRSVWYLSRALKELFSLEGVQGSFEVIVVNNDEGERRVLEHLSRKLPMRLIDNHENLGFGRAANIAATVARGQVFGFLNPDTEWRRPMLDEMRAFITEMERPQVLGLALVDERGTRESWSTGHAPHLVGLFTRKLARFPVPSGDGLEEPEWTSGGALFASRDTFESIGGFDQHFFLYFEDVDFCSRARGKGIPIRVNPCFSILHRGGKSFRSRGRQKRCYYRSQQYYFSKHRPPFEANFLRLLHFFVGQS